MGGKWFQPKERIRSIDNATVCSIFSIFNSCYKSGVKDAEYVSDPDLCAYFAATVRVPGVYGRVIHGYTMTTHEWRCHIPSINPKCGISMGAVRYLLSLENYVTSFTCALPVAQEFYIQGLCDYNANPQIHDFTLFDNKKLERWTKDNIKPRKRQDMLIDIQNFCCDRSRIDAEHKGNKSAIGERQYVFFAQAIWYAMQKPFDIFGKNST